MKLHALVRMAPVVALACLLGAPFAARATPLDAGIFSNAPLFPHTDRRMIARPPHARDDAGIFAPANQTESLPFEPDGGFRKIVALNI